MRSVFNGNLNLGLVSIPVKVYTTIKGTSMFHQVHDKCSTPISRPSFCKACDTIITPNEIKKAVILQDGKVIKMEKEDFDSLKEASNHDIAIEQFVGLDELPAAREKAYQLIPQGNFKAYAALASSLWKRRKVGIIQIVWRGQSNLAAIIAQGKKLYLQVLPFVDELQENIEVTSETVSKTEQQLLDKLVSSMSGKFNHKDYINTYRQKLNELVAAKAKGKKGPKAKTVKKTKKGEYSLAAALEASLDGTSKTTPKKRSRKVPIIRSTF